MVKPFPNLDTVFFHLEMCSADLRTSTFKISDNGYNPVLHSTELHMGASHRLFIIVLLNRTGDNVGQWCNPLTY